VTTGVSVVETRRAGRVDDGASCPMCPEPITSGQRIALVRSNDSGHAWLHVRCLAAASTEEGSPQ
jgi:hypothetical protein